MTVILKNLEKLLEKKQSNLDAKLWVQKLVLRKYLSKKHFKDLSLNKVQ